MELQLLTVLYLQHLQLLVVGMEEMVKMKKGQSTLEYALIISVVVAALMAMNAYVQRSVQANLKMVEARVNAQPAAVVTVEPPTP